MKTKPRNMGGRPRTKNYREGATNGHRAEDWGRNAGPIHITRVVNDRGRPAIRLEDNTAGNERRRVIVVPVEHLPQMGFMVAETLQLDNPAEAWAQMRLAQLLATCSQDRVALALELLRPSANQAGEIEDIFDVLDQSREATL